MNNPELGDAEFARIARFIEEHYGIRVPPEKKVMIQSRLMKRVRQLGCGSVDEYIHRLLDQPGAAAELSRMTDLVSTHMTSFFREPAHFALLEERILPQLEQRFEFTAVNPFVAWSAASSTGEEVWSLAMVLDRHRKRRRAEGRRFEWAVIGTDLSNGVLETARRAIYPLEALDTIPADLRAPCTMRARDPCRPEFRIVPELRARVGFHQLNLMEQPYPVNARVHLVFCRNVLIYFDRPHQEAVLRGLARVLEPGGFLFVGHAESVISLNLGLSNYAPTVYERPPEDRP